MDRADSSEAELDDDSGASSEADEDTEDEFAEFPESQEETDGWTVDEETNAKSGEEGDAQTEEQAEGRTLRRSETRRHSSRIVSTMITKGTQRKRNKKISC